MNGNQRFVIYAAALVLLSLRAAPVAAYFPASSNEGAWGSTEEKKPRPAPVKDVAAKAKRAEPPCTHRAKGTAAGATIASRASDVRPERVEPPVQPVREREPQEWVVQSTAKTCQQFVDENAGRRLGEFSPGVYFLREKSVDAPKLMTDGVTWMKFGSFELSTVGTSITMPQRDVVPWSAAPSDQERAVWLDFWERLLTHERGHEAILDSWLGHEIAIAGYGSAAKQAELAFQENQRRAELALATRIDQELVSYHLVAGEEVPLHCAFLL